ncbi:hypothetical protein DL765_002633 [Monosporascus sp. GIB2]|nr:hypothetical protein DL765_002633 [Monosporascus sp. GIB2]
MGNQSSEDGPDAALNDEKVQSIADILRDSVLRGNYMSGLNDSSRASTEDQKWKPFKLFRKGREHRDLISDAQMPVDDSLVAQFQCEVDRRFSSPDYARTKPSPIAEGRESLVSDQVSSPSRRTEREASIYVAGLSRSPALRVPPVLRERARQWRESYRQLSSQRKAAPQTRLANITEEREEAGEGPCRQEQSMLHGARRNRLRTQWPSLGPRSPAFPTANEITGPESLQKANDPKPRLEAACEMLRKRTVDTNGVEKYHSSNPGTAPAYTRAPPRQAASPPTLASLVRTSSEANRPVQTDSPSPFDQGLYHNHEKESSHRDAELRKPRLELEKQLDIGIQSLRPVLKDGCVKSSVPEHFARDLLTVLEATSSTASKSPMEAAMAPDGEAPTNPLSATEIITEASSGRRKSAESNPATPEPASPLFSAEHVSSGCGGQGQEEREEPDYYKRHQVEQADWLSRQEPTQWLEKPRDARFHDMEKRLERLEKNGETLMDSMVVRPPFLETFTARGDPGRLLSAPEKTQLLLLLRALPSPTSSEQPQAKPRKGALEKKGEPGRTGGERTKGPEKRVSRTETATGAAAETAAAAQQHLQHHELKNRESKEPAKPGNVDQRPRNAGGQRMSRPYQLVAAIRTQRLSAYSARSEGMPGH